MMPKKSPTTQQNQMPPKKVYSREFKLEALRLLKSSDKTKGDLERELGLYPGHERSGARLWERAFIRKGENVEQAFPGTGHQSEAAAELRKLRRELEIVRQDRDIPKKAIAYEHSPVFSRTQDPD